MDLRGLNIVTPEETELIDRLAHMMGTSFLEEYWTQTWLSALDEIGITYERKLEISQVIIKSNFTVGSRSKCVYTLPDASAAAGGYLSSDLQGRTWSELEDEATALTFSSLAEHECRILEKRAEQMKPISNFSWMHQDPDTENRDFIHFYALGVDPDKRGTGAFRRMFTPFLDYAKEHGLACYLECYSEKTENIYSHFGFEVVTRISDPAFDIVQRCMKKLP